MSMRDLIEGEVEVDEEENDDSFDEETGEVRHGKGAQNGHIDDSSEEEDDDDDEEAARAVCFRSLWLLLCALIADSFIRSARALL
jgi:transcription elongation factor SPT6